MKSSYPFGTCPAHIRHYDVTLIYATYAKSGKIQIAGFFKVKSLQIQINNKTIIEFGSRRM